MSQPCSTPNKFLSYWNEEDIRKYSFDAKEGDFGQQDQLQFQPVSYDDRQYDMYLNYPGDLNPLISQPIYQREGFSPEPYTPPEAHNEEVDEPPLLEELGIDPNRILEKTVAVLNPFHRFGPNDANVLLQDTDLAGPIAFCVTMGACILLSGGKAPFGYVYGLAVTSCILMYFLLNLMTMSNEIKLSSVASVLGYCLLPAVVLSAVGVFVSLRSAVGLVLSLVSVVLCCESSSRLFVMMLGGSHQRPLVAYPCGLLYAVFTLITIF